MLATSTRSCRSRLSSSSARPTRSFGPRRRRSQLHWLRHAPALASCSSSSITHSGGSRLKNETPPITELSQERSSMQKPALATPCPLALRSAAAWTRTGTGTRARTRPPESLPRLDLSTTRRPCRGRLSFGEKSSRSFKVERLGGAHAHRTQLHQLKYVTMRTHRLLCVSSSAERALAQPPKYIGRKYDLYHHHSHPSQKCNITTHKNHKRG